MLRLAASVALLAAVLPAAPQDLVLKNATVHTGTAEAWRGPIVVRDGRIAPPGAEPPRGAVEIDLEGAFVTAGLQDAHGHLLGLGSALESVDLVGTRSYQEVIDRVARRAKDLPPGRWVLGRGWDQNDWPDSTMPHHAELSLAVPDHPVWLVRIDGHAGLLNLRGLLASGVRADTAVPSGGEILLDEDGEPTGVLVDRAMALVPTPEPTREDIRRRLLLAQEQCLRHGLTCVHDAGVSGPVLEEMRLLDASRQWVLRTYVMLAATERDLIARGPWRSRDGLIRVRAVKGYSDGALGSRGAALLEPYADRPGHRGLAMMPRGVVRELASFCIEHGMQLCVHAIGDRANHTVLDAFAAVAAGDEEAFAARRFRIEHAQVFAEGDFDRAAALGVLASMQPTHLTSDMPWAPDRLGPERTLRAYAWRSFLRRGVVVPFGSDFPVESVDPRKGLFAAVTTCGEDGKPDGGFRPDQRLSRAEAIRGFTKFAAHAMFAEGDLGTIESGKIADLTVFGTDLLRCRDDELLGAKILLTIVGGRVEFDGRGR